MALGQEVNYQTSHEYYAAAYELGDERVSSGLWLAT